jgi:L-rhamnose mutarotase
MRRCLLLDLHDDPALIAEYEAQHRAVWPQVLAHLREQGVVGMQIYRLGTRLCMVMETDDRRFDAARMAAAAAAHPVVQAWEALMWRFQAPTPWTPAGAKWVDAALVFDLAEAGG